MLPVKTAAGRFMPALFIVAMLAACQPTPAMKTGLTLVIDRTTAQKAEVTAYAKAENANRARQEAFLRQMETETTESRVYTAGVIDEWTLAGDKVSKEALAILKQLRKSDDAIRKDPLGMASPTSKTLGKAGKTFAKVKADVSHHDTIISTYTKLKKGRSSAEAVSFYIGFAKDVAKEQKKLEDAKKGTGDAEDKAQNTAKGKISK